MSIFGIIGFDHLKISCIIGVFENERQMPQDIFMDLRVKYDFSKAVLNDALNDAVCYETLSKICINKANLKNYFLLETFANEVIETLFKEFPIVYAYIKIKKPKAIKQAKYAVIELEKGKK